MLYKVRLCVAVVQSDSTSLTLVSVGKVRTHITITVNYCDSVSVFYCFRDITIFCRKFAFFCRLYPPQSRLKPSQEFSPMIYGMKVGIKTIVPRLHDGEHRTSSFDVLPPSAG